MSDWRFALSFTSLIVGSSSTIFDNALAILSSSPLFLVTYLIYVYGTENEGLSYTTGTALVAMLSPVAISSFPIAPISPA